MVEVARLVGMERREYEKDGQQRKFCCLHLVHEANSVDGVIGSAVECPSCPRGVNPDRLKVGALYELVYRHYTFKGQKMAQLVGLEPVEDQ